MNAVLRDNMYLRDVDFSPHRCHPSFDEFYRSEKGGLLYEKVNRIHCYSSTYKNHIMHKYNFIYVSSPLVSFAKEICRESNSKQETIDDFKTLDRVNVFNESFITDSCLTLY